MQDEAFERMRQAVYAVAAVSGRVRSDALDRDHDLRGLLFAVYTAGVAGVPRCACGGANQDGAPALPPHAGNDV